MRASTERTLADSIAIESVLAQQPSAAHGPAMAAERPFLATPDSLFERGLCYSTGQGVPQDLIRAHSYFNLAALAGNARAREMRTEVAQDMTPADIAAAQRLAREMSGIRH